MSQAQIITYRIRTGKKSSSRVPISAVLHTSGSQHTSLFVSRGIHAKTQMYTYCHVPLHTYLNLILRFKQSCIIQKQKRLPT